MAIDLNNGFKELVPHADHELQVATYGPWKGEIVNVSLDCITCGMVLIEFDNPAIT